MNRKGFTIIEMLIAMVISMVVLGSIISVYLMQSKKYDREEYLVEMQENARAGIDMVTRELMNAGYDPTGSADAGVLLAEDNSVRFTMDLDGNGAISGANEDITYALDGTDLQLTRNGQPVAENITAVVFTYYDNTNTALSDTPLNSTDLAKVRRISVNLTAQTSKPVSLTVETDEDGNRHRVLLELAGSGIVRLLSEGLVSTAYAAGQGTYKTTTLESDVSPPNLRSMSDPTSPAGGGDDDDDDDDDDDS